MPLPFRQETLAQIRRRIGYLIYGRNNFFYATATGGSASQIVAEFVKRYPDNFYAGKTVYIVAGTGSGQARNVSGSTQSAGILTITPNWTVTPDATSVFELWPDSIQPEEVNNAINMAVNKAADICQVYLETANPTVDSTRKVVTIPTNFVALSGFKYLYSSTNTWYTFYYQPWMDVTRTPGYTVQGNKVYLTEEIISSVAGTDIYVCGYRLPNALSADTDVAEVRPDYLALMGAYLIEATASEGQALDPEQHSGRAGNWLREAQAIEARMQTAWKPNTIEVQQ